MRLPIPAQIICRVAVATSLATLSMTSLAAQYVSIKQDAVNLRTGPGTQHDATWRLAKGYPLKVQSRQGRWLKVVDVEKDSGWVYAPLTSKQVHHIVKSPVANVRSGPGIHYRKVGQAQFGDIVRPVARKGNWVKVRRAEGHSGWVSRKLLWGW